MCYRPSATRRKKSCDSEQEASHDQLRAKTTIDRNKSTPCTNSPMLRKLSRQAEYVLDIWRHGRTMSCRDSPRQVDQCFFKRTTAMARPFVDEYGIHQDEKDAGAHFLAVLNPEPDGDAGHATKETESIATGKLARVNGARGGEIEDDENEDGKGEGK